MPNPLDTLYDQLKGQYPDLVDRSEFIGKLSNEEELKKLHDAASKDIPGFVDFDNFKSKVGESLSTYDQDSDYKTQNTASTGQENAETVNSPSQQEESRPAPSEPQNSGIESEASVPDGPTATSADAEAFDRETGDLDELGRRYDDKVKRLEGYGATEGLYANEEAARKHYEAYSRLLDEAEQDRLVYNRRVKAADREREEAERKEDLKSADDAKRLSAEYAGFTDKQYNEEVRRLNKEKDYLNSKQSQGDPRRGERIRSYNASITALAKEGDKRKAKAEAMDKRVKAVTSSPNVQKRYTSTDTLAYLFSGASPAALRNNRTALERAKTMTPEELIQGMETIASQDNPRGINPRVDAMLAGTFNAYLSQLSYLWGGDKPKDPTWARYDMMSRAMGDTQEDDNFITGVFNYLNGNEGYATAGYQTNPEERANIPQMAITDKFWELVEQEKSTQLERAGKTQMNGTLGDEIMKAQAMPGYSDPYAQAVVLDNQAEMLAQFNIDYDALLQKAIDSFGDQRIMEYAVSRAYVYDKTEDKSLNEVYQDIYDNTIGKVIGQYEPKNGYDFFMRQVWNTNIFSKIFQLGVRAKSGTLGKTDDYAAVTAALERYAQDHQALTLGATAFNFVVTEAPFFIATGGLSSMATQTAERALFGPAVKALSSSLLYRMGRGALASSLTGLQYGFVTDAVDRGLNEGTFDFAKTLSASLHYGRDFAVMGAGGELFGVTNNMILRSAKDGRLNRLGATTLHFMNNAGKTLANATAATGMYAFIDKPALERENKRIEAENKKISEENKSLPKDKQKPLKPLNEVAGVKDMFWSNIAMFASLDAVHALRGMWGVARGKYDENMHNSGIHFDKYDREALKKVFGKNPNSLLRQIVFGQIDGVPAKWFEIDPEAEQEIYQELGRELTQEEKEEYASYGFTELRKVILDDRIPWVTRAKIVTAVTGRPVGMPPVMDADLTTVMGDDGHLKSVVVRSYDAAGTLIETREFSAKQAEKATSVYESLRSSAWRNNALLSGRLVLDAIEDKTYADTVDEMAREKGISSEQFEQMVFGIKQKDITGEKVTYRERQLVEEFDKRHIEKYDAEVKLTGPDALIEQVAREVYGEKWKAALKSVTGKRWSSMTPEDKEFIERYTDRLGRMGIAERTKMLASRPGWVRAVKEMEESVKRNREEPEVQVDESREEETPKKDSVAVEAPTRDEEEVQEDKVSEEEEPVKRESQEEPAKPAIEDEKVSVETPVEERVEPVPEVIELEEEKPAEPEPVKEETPAEEPAAEEKPDTEGQPQAGTIGFEPVEQPTERERFDAERKAKAATITDADIEANREALGIPEGTALTDEARQIYAEDLAEDLMRYERFKRGESDEKARFHDYWESKFNPKRPKLEKPIEKQEEPEEEEFEEEEVTEADALIEQFDNLKGRSDLERYRNALKVFAGDDEIMAILEDLEPHDITEWVSSFLGLDSGKGYSMLWKSKTRGGTVIAKGFKEETGWSWNDVKGFAFMFDNKNGMSPRRVAEKIWEELPSGIKDKYSDVDVFNIMMDLFGQSSRKSDLTGYIRNNRMEQVRELLNRRRSNELDEIARYKERERRGDEEPVAPPVSDDEEQNEFAVREDDVAPFSLLSLAYSHEERKDGTLKSRFKARRQMETIGKMLGYKVQWVVDKPYNAMIDTEGKALYINLRTDQPLAAVMGHEITHDLRKSDPKAYEALKRYAKDLLGQAQWDREVTDTKDFYGREYKRLGRDPFSEEKAEEEVVCDTMGKVLHTRKGLRELAGSLDPGVAGKVYRLLKDITDKVKSALGKEHDYSTMDLALRDFLNAVKQRAKKDIPIQDAPIEDDFDIDFSLRRKPAPKNTGVGYKVFFLKDGKLYPPMVANIGGEATPFGVWLDADAAPIAGKSKTGRNKVKAGGKGTQGGSGTLAYRPGWHLGKIPYALQFNRGKKVPNPLGILNKKGQVIEVGEFFPNDFVWAEVEYAADKDYQEEAHGYGVNANGKYNPSLAGLPRVPEDGSYEYRTNPNPATDPWIITGAMKVNKILKPSEVDAMVRAAGREPQKRQEGAFTDEQIDALNRQLSSQATDSQHGLSIDPSGGYSVTDKADIESLAPRMDGESEAAYNERVGEIEADEKAFVDGDGQFSLKREDTMRDNSVKYFEEYHVRGNKDRKYGPLRRNSITRQALDKANEMIAEMRDYIAPWYDRETGGNRYLPEEVYGLSTIFDNASYGATLENTLICTRTLAYNDFCDSVKRKLGRPLTKRESFLASQMLYDIATDPQCLYCYVSLDRKAYDEYLLRYFDERDAVIERYNKMADKSAENIDALYKTFLDGRKDTYQMRSRFNSWLMLADHDSAIGRDKVALSSDRKNALAQESNEEAAVRWRDITKQYNRLRGEEKKQFKQSKQYLDALHAYLATEQGQIKDACAYAQGASWAKKEAEYRSYTGELLRTTKRMLGGLASHYGLRFYSFSEYSPAFILENMQMIRDAALRGLKGFAYTKEIDFCKIFLPTGININCSTYGRRNAAGEIVMDERQGANWDEARALRDQYENMGIVFVATDDEMVRWAKEQPWIDVIIPFHIVRTGADIAEFYGWTNYTNVSADYDAQGRHKDIMPPEHNNSIEDYDRLIAERGLTRRFPQFYDGPGDQNYMKLINETRRKASDTPILTPVFNMEEAKKSFDKFVEKGGYWGGFYEVGADDVVRAVDEVVSDIEAGKSAGEVEYGRQDIDFDAAMSNLEKTRRRINRNREHGNTPKTSFSLKREDRNAPTFYSNAAKAVENVKQNKATAEQWKAMLTKAGGIKAGEDKWMGLSQWLDEHKGKTLTKEEVAQFVADNGIEMREVNYEEHPSRSTNATDLFLFTTELTNELIDLHKTKNLSVEEAFQDIIEKYGPEALDYVHLEDPGLIRPNKYIDEKEALAFFGQEVKEDEIFPIDSTRLEYTTDGLENKREIAFVVPDIEPYQEHDEIHFGPENQGRAVMWVRFGETTDTDGKRVLVIDEIQSNRHQDAREKGYKVDEETAYAEYRKAISDYRDAEKRGNKDAMKDAEKRYEYYGAISGQLPGSRESYQGILKGAIPAAPFEKNWHEVAMKRMLRLAAEEGFDKVAWTTGEQQADRYDLRKVIGSVSYTKNSDGTYNIVCYKTTPEAGEYTYADDGLTENQLRETIGAGLTEKIVNGDGDQFGSSRRVIRLDENTSISGGEGMSGFYDKMLPQFMNKYGKRWGVKTGEVTLDTPGKEVMHSVDVTPEMRRSVMEQGQPLFSLKREIRTDADGNEVYTETREDGTKDREITTYGDGSKKALWYDDKGNLKERLDYFPNGEVKQVANYDSDGNLTRNIQYDENRRTTSYYLPAIGTDWKLDENGIARGKSNGVEIKPYNFQFSLKTYHGSGADFDRFNHDYVGSGEGAQAYGWGTYVTEVEGIGRRYAMIDYRRDGSRNHFLYSVEIPDEKEGKYLPYGERVIDPKVRKVLTDRLQQMADEYWNGEIPSYKLTELDKALNTFMPRDIASVLECSDKEVSQLLSKAGYTGVKYVANVFNRGQKGLSYNYVIFNEKDLGITDKEQFSLKRRRNRDDYTDEDRADAAIIANTYLAQADALRQQIEADREREHQLVEERNRLLAFDYPAADPADRPAIMDRINALRNQINDLRNANYENNTKLRSMDYEYRVAKEILEQGAVTDEEAARFDAGQMTREEKVLESLFKAAADSRADKKAKQKAIRSLVRELAAITDNFKAAMKARGIESQRKHYDKGTVDHIIRLAKAMMGTGYIDNMTSYEVKRLMGMINNAATRESIETQAGRIVDMMLDHQIRTLRKDFDKQLKVTGQKTNSSGVQVQAGLDQEGQVVMEAMRKSMQIIADSAGERYDSNGNITEWGEFYEKTLNDMGDEDPVKAEQARKIFEGVWLASKWYEDVRTMEINGRILRSQMEDFKASNKPAKDADKDTKQRYNDVLADYQEMLRQNKIKIIEAYERMTGDVGMTQAESVRRAKEFADEQKQRVNEIQHNANSDLADVDDNTQVETPESRVFGANKNNVLARLLFASAGTYEKFMRFFGRMAPNGEGYLFKRFMTQYHHARQDYWKGRHSAFEEMDKKMAEVFGKKKMHWSDIYEMTRDHKKFPPITVSYWDGYRNGQPFLRVDELNQSEALYLYMINKMPDGRMKLRHMGITDDVVQQMAGQIDGRLIQLADWLQSEFLPKMRIKYNETHKRVFGADMAAIEDYFPLRINKLAVASDMDITERDMNDNKPSTITGAIVKRRVNTLPIDLHTDAFDVALSHIDEMEHWSAFAEFNRDNNTLVNYKRFRTKVNNMRSLELGAGNVLWKNFTDAVAIAADAYHPRAGSRSGDHYSTRVAKFVSTAKIALRPYTALKQLLSIPAFWADSDPLEQMKATLNVADTWQWAIENLPGFAERWQSRQAGNIKLANYNDLSGLRRRKTMRKLQRAGMWANAAIDGLACAMGGKAVYETKYKRYLRMGYDDARAQEKALIDAAIAYNNSQQSSEGAYVSPLQVDRTWFANAFSVFRSASMGYTRRFNTALRQLRNATFKPGYGAKSVEFLKKQMIRDGLTEEQAEKWAHRIYRRANLKAAASVAIFGQILPFAWNLGTNMFYLLFGDDDKEKKKILADSFRHSFFGPIEGLVGGNVYSELGDIAADTAIGNIWGDSIWGDSNAFKALGYRDFSTMPLSSDINNVLKYFARDEVKAANEVVNILFQVATGVNPQTITDWVTAILDLSRSDMERRDIAMFVMRMLSTPQSQLDKFYLDQMNISQEQASKMSVDDLIKRYATYKRWRETPLTGWWMYSNEREKKVEEKFQKRYEEMLEERAAGEDGLRGTINKMTDLPRKRTMMDKLQKELTDSIEATDPELYKKALEGEKADDDEYVRRVTDKDVELMAELQMKKKALKEAHDRKTKADKDFLAYKISVDEYHKICDEVALDWKLYNMMGTGLSNKINEMKDTMEQSDSKLTPEEAMDSIRTLYRNALNWTQDDAKKQLKKDKDKYKKRKKKK